MARQVNFFLKSKISYKANTFNRQNYGGDSSNWVKLIVQRQKIFVPTNSVLPLGHEKNNRSGWGQAPVYQTRAYRTGV